MGFAEFESSRYHHAFLEEEKRRDEIGQVEGESLEKLVQVGVELTHAFPVPEFACWWSAIRAIKTCFAQGLHSSDVRKLPLTSLKKGIIPQHEFELRKRYP